VLAAGPATVTTEVENGDGSPLGVLAAGPTTVTTEVEDVDGGPPGGCWRHVRQQPPQKLKTSTASPREVPELKVRERPPSMLRNIDGGPPGGAGVGGPREPTFNVKKRRRWALGRCRS
jgi:hypothetical protein